ncbi:MAG: gliding motility-associated C-terminal domain-containing protein [Bacteroidota bacterium]
MKAIILSFLSILIMPTFLFGQIDVTITVTGGTATSTCTNEPFLSPGIEPLWRVEVEGEGYITYTDGDGCFTNLPNEQYAASYNCVADVPATVQVCFEAFENDAPFYEINVGCGILENCIETICQDFNIPAPGASTNETLAIPATAASSGEVNFTLSTSADLSNDQICNAIDLGTISSGEVIGDVNAGIYDNLCGTNTNEINPADNGDWQNDNGVWFTFFTSPTVGPELVIRLLSDPEMVGDSIDLQIALYTSDNGNCDGDLSLVRRVSNINTYNSQLDFNCPMASTQYFLLVDGGYADFPASITGVFSLEILDVGTEEAGNFPCQAEDLGAIPANGSVSLNGFRSNFCANGVGDPFNPSFVTQTSVWFQFTPPPSGHVLIEGISDRMTDSIGIQLALYRAFGDACDGIFIHTASNFTVDDLDETLQVTCLFDDRPYWIMVDGSGSNGRGIFTLAVSDAGDITPREMLVDTICAGETFPVGFSSEYSETGMYSDTLQLFAGCDSIVNLDLTVLPPIEITINQTRPAILEGGANGQAEVSAIGGTGVYSFAWCNGETASVANALVGGSECCITVTDDFGCEAIECFTVEFVTPIIPSFENDTLLCNGDANGVVTFSAIDGDPPYNYVWQNTDNTLNGNGVISAAGEVVNLPDLPAGDYSVTISDLFFDTSFTAVVVEPDLLELLEVSITNASCFAFCDGQAEVEATGGVGGYVYTWPGSIPMDSVQMALCAGIYTVSVTDANACEATLDITIAEPDEFIATATEVMAVSCFEGSDGIAEVTSNDMDIAYSWDNMNTTATIDSLSAGTYFVTVTNSDGCLDTTFVEITQPTAPVGVQATIAEEISCFGESDGLLQAIVSGPGTSFTYLWSSGDTQATTTGLPTGNYTVTVANELGCEAETAILLPQPDSVMAQVTPVNLTCLDPPNGGQILVESVSGGRPGYTFSLDGEFYTPDPFFANLFDGSYTVFVQDSSGCIEQYDVSILPPPPISVTLGEDPTIALGDTYALQAETENPATATFTWSGLSIDTNATDPSNLLVLPFESTAYSVTVQDTVTFCTATDNIFITVSKERRIFIPNAFSPNNDGANDEFYIFAGPGIRTIKSFRVFTRTGNMVFEQEDISPNDPNVGWNGMFLNQALNTGVYVYMAEIEFLDGIVEVFDGSVMLMK